MASLCHLCAHHDWQVAFVEQPSHPVWEFICLSAGEYEAGDAVESCPGYLPEKEKHHER